MLSILSSVFLCSLASFPIPVPGVAARPQEDAAFEIQLRPRATRAPQRTVELPLAWRGSMPTVEVWVNGQGPFTFAIDTGGQGSARVSPSLIERLQLPIVGEIQGGDPSGRATVTMPVAELEHMSIGDVEFEGIQAASREYAAMPGSRAIDGILGIHLFAEIVITLDYETQRLLLSQAPYFPPRGALMLPLTSDPDGIPSVAATLGDMSLNMMIDTGKMGGLGVPAEMIPSLTLLEEPRVAGRGRTITGVVEIMSAKVSETFALGNLRIEEPTLEYTDLMAVSILGSKFLKGRVLTIDQTERRAWIRDAAVDRRLAERNHAPDSTTLAGPFEYPIDITSGRPWLQVSVGSREPDPFLFDTGASVTVIDDDYARELGLIPTGKTPIGDPSSPRGFMADTYLLSEVSFGDVYFEGVPAVAMDLHAVFPNPASTPKAILGLPVFSDLLMTLDYAEGVIRVEEGSLADLPEGTEFVLPLDTNSSGGGGLPSFQIEVAGTTMEAMIDSGAPMALSLPGSFMESLRLVGAPVQSGNAQTVSASSPIHSATLDGVVRIGGLILESKQVLFMDRLQRANLGSGFLKKHVITMDLKHRLLRVYPGE